MPHCGPLHFFQSYGYNVCRILFFIVEALAIVVLHKLVVANPVVHRRAGLSKTFDPQHTVNPRKSWDQCRQWLFIQTWGGSALPIHLCNRRALAAIPKRCYARPLSPSQHTVLGPTCSKHESPETDWMTLQRNWIRLLFAILMEC